MARAVEVVCFCLTVVQVLTVTADDGCKSFWCFSIFSKRVNIDFNLWKLNKPVPIENVISQFGYPVESHEIKTEDGYLLKYHRIPHGKNSSSSTHKPVPVLLQHGLLAASSCWVLSEHSLGYTLADAGFDVWLGNARGNTYSRKHDTLDPDTDKKAFWDFSWHEMGYYDLPASIDYILKETGRDQLLYIGHSMGTTMYFVLGATRPEYMKKIRAAVTLAPVIYPWNVRSPLANFLITFKTILDWVSKGLGVYELLPYSEKTFWFDQNICSRPKFQFICREILFYIGGSDAKDLKRVPLETIFQHVPAGAAYKQIQHFRQINIEDSAFRQFDYGYIRNYWIYDSFNPPAYNLTYVKSPLYIYYASNDWLAVPQDVLHAVEHLPNVKRVTKIPNDQFNHLDFMWALDAKSLLYDNIISTLQNLT